MRLRAVKQGVVVLLTLSTFILHKQREGSNASPPSVNGIANFRELELEQELEFTSIDPKILKFYRYFIVRCYLNSLFPTCLDKCLTSYCSCKLTVTVMYTSNYSRWINKCLHTN